MRNCLLAQLHKTIIKGDRTQAQDTFSASQSSVGNSHRYIFSKQLTVMIMIETFYQYLFSYYDDKHDDTGSAIYGTVPIIYLFAMFGSWRAPG